jgi:hypothetical protein
MTVELPSDRVHTVGFMAEPIPVKAASRELGVPERNLYQRAEEGLITVTRRDSGRARVLVPDLDVCRAEVEALQCQAPGCDRPAHRAGRFCSHACSVREYAAETRHCKQCGESLDVPGYLAKEPGDIGWFCDPVAGPCGAAVKRANERRTDSGEVLLPDRLTPHKLRHTCASVLVALGVDPGSVMDQLGHTGPAFTLRVYRHGMRRDERSKRALRELVGLLDQPSDWAATGSSRDLGASANGIRVPQTRENLAVSGAFLMGTAGLEPATSRV